MNCVIRFAVVLLLFAGSLSALGQAAPPELSQLYASGQLDAVIARGEQELRARSGQPLINMLVGRAHADKQQFQAATPYLSRSLADAGSPADVKAWSQAYLGTCYYALQDYARAQAAFAAVVAAAATRNVTAYAARRLGALRARELAAAWLTLETAHFRFHLQAPQNLPDAPAAYAAAHERAYEASNRFFQAALPRKIDYYVWDEQPAARQVLGQDAGFALPELLMVHALKNQTKGHETAHLLLAYGPHPGQSSRLINEGAAVCFDQTSRNRLQVARQATGGAVVDVWKMWQQPQAYPDEQLYAVGGALLDYLLTHGAEADVKQLLREQTPQRGRQLFGPQIAAFERELAPADARAGAPLPPAAASKAPAALELPAPGQLDAALVAAAVERGNSAAKYYKVLVLLNGVPIPGSQLEKISPAAITNMKAFQGKEELQAYAKLDLNAVIMVTTAD